MSNPVSRNSWFHQNRWFHDGTRQFSGLKPGTRKFLGYFWFFSALFFNPEKSWFYRVFPGWNPEPGIPVETLGLSVTVILLTVNEQIEKRSNVPRPTFFLLLYFSTTLFLYSSTPLLLYFSPLLSLLFSFLLISYSPNPLLNNSCTSFTLFLYSY